MAVMDRRRLGLAALAGWVGLALPWRVVSGAGGRPTPAQTEGPFYPVRRPPGAGPELVRVPGQHALARGDLLALEGEVVDRDGRPRPGITVEIWQVDHQGIYNHPRAPGHEGFDPRFQGYGESVTGEGGRYRFLTIVPAVYPGRTPHVHAKLKAGGRTLLTTQIYLAGHPMNARDGLLRRLLARTGPVDLYIDPAPAGELQGRPLLGARFRFVV